MPSGEELAFKKVKQTLKDWEEARQETSKVIRQYVASGPVGTDGRILMPPKVFNEEGAKECLKAEAFEKQKHETYLRALEEWRKSRGRSI